MPLGLQDLQGGLAQEAPQADQLGQLARRAIRVTWQDRLDQLVQVAIH